MYNRQIFSLLLLGVMLGLGYWVVKPFLVPVAWAAIIAFLTWPAYRRLRQPFEQHSFVAALIMTTLLIILLVLPISWFLVRMQSELVNAYETLASQFSDRPLLLLDAIARIPIVGSTLHDLLTNYWNDPLFWKVVVHPTDNILRPLLISSATDIPLLIVVFGVVGGLFAFGIVGMFLGPLILAVLLAIWREWLGDDQPKPTDSV